MNEESCSLPELDLIDIYRDFESYYEGLPAKEKVVFQLWLATGNELFASHLFDRFLVHDAVHSLKIAVTPGANKFTFIRA